MADPVLVLCGGAPTPRRPAKDQPTLRLTIGPGRDQVHLGVARLSAQLLARAPAVEADLLEVAAYVYAADQALTRGGTKEFEYGELWRRSLRFRVAVRRPDVWAAPAATDALRAALGFLTDDEYEFEFTQAAGAPGLDGYLTEAPADPAAPEVEEVVLFSGGLDSLGGAVEELLAGQRLTALVSHRPANHVHARQRVLAAALRARLPHPGLAPLHVGLVANKGPALDREFTQRSRAFLFAAAAAVVARQLGRRRVRFYENGVTSLNLPVSPQLIGGRASRTTHPQTLARLGRLFSVLFDAPFAVENPFLWRTKAQILERLAGLGHADLCARTSSCAHPRTRTRRHPHCGLCSQCVDRRVSALAARLPDAADPPGGYERDVLTGERDGAALTFVERYVGTALDLEGVPSAVRFAARYGEVNQAIPYVGLPAGAAAAALYDLHRRHAEGGRGVVARALADRTGDLIRQAFPARSLLGVVIGRAARRPAEVVAPAVVAPGRPAAGGRFVLDETRFEARCGGKACGFGNTNEYWVVKELAKDAGGCVSVAALQAAVWRDAVVEKNTIQKTVGNARRKLRRLPGVTIASLKDHYRLVLPPG